MGITEQARRNEISQRIGQIVAYNFLTGELLLNDQPASCFSIDEIRPGLPFGHEYGLAISPVSIRIAIDQYTDIGKQLSLQEVDIELNPVLNYDSRISLVLERNPSVSRSLNPYMDEVGYTDRLNQFITALREQGIIWNKDKLLGQTNMDKVIRAALMNNYE